MKPREERNLLCQLKTCPGVVMSSLSDDMKCRLDRLIRKIEVRQVNDIGAYWKVMWSFE